MTDTFAKVRKFKKGRDFKFDMMSTNESEVKTRRQHLQSTNHYTQIVKQLIGGVLHYLLYKSKKSMYQRFYPISRRLGL